MDAKINILYVDDEPFNLMLFEEIFCKKYNVFSALSGIEGLNILRSNINFIVVINDIKMPEIDGIEFIIEAKKEFPDLKYYIFTGFDASFDIAEALRTELIDNLISKPMDIKEIEKAITQAI
jgi:response regulator RpfG family c-di-GMP phosphodiesterase